MKAWQRMRALTRLALMASVCITPVLANPGAKRHGHAHTWAQKSKEQRISNHRTADKAPELALSLSDAVFLALRKNPAIRSAYVERVAQKYDLRVAEDVFTPHATLSGNASYGTNQGVGSSNVSLSPNVTVLTPIGTQFNFSWDNDLTTSGGTITKSSTVSATVTQPLLQGAGLDVNLAPVRTAQLAEDVNKLQLRLTVSQTITSVILGYRQLMQAEEARKLADDAVVRAQALIDINRAMINAGRMARMDLAQAQAALENQKLSVLQSAEAVETARLSLAALLDIDLRTIIIVRDKLRPTRATIAIEKAITLALNRNPSYLAQKDAVQQEQLGIVVADNERLWNLSVVGNGTFGKQWVSGGGLPASRTTIANGAVGLSLNAPLNGLQIDQPYIDAKSSFASGEIQLEAGRLALEQQVRTAAMDIDLNWQALDVAEKALGYAATAVSVERQKLALGKSTNINVQTLEDSYLQAESQSLNARIAYVDSLASFDLTLGTTLDTWKISLRDE